MANKIRDVFNNDEIFVKGKIRFNDLSTSQQFKEALEKVYESGEAVKLEGEAAMSVEVNAGSSILPLEDFERVTGIVVGPSAERIEIPLDVDGEIIQFPVELLQLNDGFIIQTLNDHVIFTKMILHPVAKTANIKITPRYQNACSTTDVIRSIKQIQALINVFFVERQEGVNSGIETIKGQLQELYEIFERTNYVEEKFGISFIPKEINLNDEESLRDLLELCIAIRKGIALRLNAKLTSTESTGITVNHDMEIKENEPIVLSFLGGLEYHIWGNEIKLHTANLLCNAFVKSIETYEDGNIRVIYGDVESNPMYISYKGYLTEEEAREELQQVMDHKEEYEKAKTVYQYLALSSQYS